MPAPERERDHGLTLIALTRAIVRPGGCTSFGALVGLMLGRQVNGSAMDDIIRVAAGAVFGLASGFCWGPPAVPE